MKLKCWQNAAPEQVLGANKVTPRTGTGNSDPKKKVTKSTRKSGAFNQCSDTTASTAQYLREIKGDAPADYNSQ